MYFKLSSLPCIISFLCSHVCFGHLPHVSDDPWLPIYLQREVLGQSSRYVHEACQPVASMLRHSVSSCGANFSGNECLSSHPCAQLLAPGEQHEEREPGGGVEDVDLHFIPTSLLHHTPHTHCA